MRRFFFKNLHVRCVPGCFYIEISPNSVLQQREGAEKSMRIASCSGNSRQTQTAWCHEFEDQKAEVWSVSEQALTKCIGKLVSALGGSSAASIAVASPSTSTMESSSHKSSEPAPKYMTDVRCCRESRDMSWTETLFYPHPLARRHGSRMFTCPIWMQRI